MEDKVISKADFSSMVDRLIQEGEYDSIEGVKTKDGKYFFGSLTNSGELCLDYDVTLLPPKKYFLPQRETVITFRQGERPAPEPVAEASSVVLIGVHPYDLKAMELCEAVYSAPPADPNLMIRKSKTVVIGVDCLNPNPQSFSASMGFATTESGYDLMLTDIGDSYVVSVGTDRGADLLARYGRAADATATNLARRDEVREMSLGRYEKSLSMPADEIPAILNETWDSRVFAEKSEVCLSCGSCVMVCPTCVCFDVEDTVALSLDSGERYRKWDSCMLTDFAKVATGENFREDRESRFRHRMHRKGKYLLERYDKPGCVGCGRCGLACLVDIALPADTYNLLKEAS